MLQLLGAAQHNPQSLYGTVTPTVVTEIGGWYHFLNYAVSGGGEGSKFKGA